tara:strand:+ start:530 stop:685 length:156 start_codon:yes stop_codon:yes gene_type:complete
MRAVIKICITTKDFSIDELLELVEWKIDSLQKEMPGKVNITMAGYEIQNNS